MKRPCICSFLAETGDQKGAVGVPETGMGSLEFAGRLLNWLQLQEVKAGSRCFQ